MSIEKLRTDIDRLTAGISTRGNTERIRDIAHLLLDEHEESGDEADFNRPDKWSPAEEAIQQYGEERKTK